jgi:hypothetical protein
VLLYRRHAARARGAAGDSSDDGARAAVQAALDWRDGRTWQAGAVERRGDWAFVGAWGRADADPLTALARWSGRAGPGAARRPCLPGLAARARAGCARAGRSRLMLAGVEPATAVFTQGYRLPWTAAIESAVTGQQSVERAPQPGRLRPGRLGRERPDRDAKPGVIVYLKESSNRGCWSLYCWRQANMVVVQHGPVSTRGTCTSRTRACRIISRWARW